MWFLSSLKRNSIFLLLFFFFTFNFVSASNLTLSPDSLFIENGKSFVVSFYVSNNETAINAISAQISYPKDLLRLTSFSKNGSLLQMWSEEPSFSNIIGSAHFEGVVLNPGFSSKKGLVVTARFTALARGVATIRITSGNIYANDGKATDVLSLLGTGTYTIVEANPNEIPRLLKKSATDASQIIVTSETHAFEDRWYPSKKVTLHLEFPLTTESIKYTLAGQKGNTINTTMLRATSSLSLVLQNDGKYIFNAKAKQGISWGQESMFTLNVDTEIPTMVDAELIYGTSSTKVFQKVNLSAKDTLSGISHFDYKLNDGKMQTIEANEMGEAEVLLPKALLRDNRLLVIAYDKANNSKTMTLPFYISSLDQPTIISYTKELKARGVFNLSAKTYPNAVLLVALESAEGSLKKTVTSNEQGDISFSTIIEKQGMYTASIKVINFEEGESDIQNIGQVKVNYSLAWFFSLFGAQTVLYIFFGSILVLVSSLLSIVITKKMIKKSIENDTALFLTIPEQTKKSEECASQMKEGGF